MVGLMLKKSSDKQHILSQWESQNIIDELCLTTKIEWSIGLRLCNGSTKFHEDFHCKIQKNFDKTFLFKHQDWQQSNWF